MCFKKTTTDDVGLNQGDSGRGESGRDPRSGEAGLAACGDWLGAEAEGEAVVKDEDQSALSGSWAIP